MTLNEAVQQRYNITVQEAKATSTLRLQGLAQFCAEELERRGLEGTETEAAIPGGGREKQWDVAWRLHGKYRLAVSLKSILRNLAGTVPNRIDDLIGEVANAQMYSPEIIIGYLMVFDTAQDSVSARHGTTWCQVLRQRLTDLSGSSGIRSWIRLRERGRPTWLPRCRDGTASGWKWTERTSHTHSVVLKQSVSSSSETLASKFTPTEPVSCFDLHRIQFPGGVVGVVSFSWEEGDRSVRSR